jgi:TonB family protein
VDQAIKLNSVNAITAHVDELRGVALTENDFALSSDLLKVDNDSIKVASGVMQGIALTQPRPEYPERARLNRISGTVLLGARIGTDGRIHALKLLKVPDPDLAIAAVTAVRQWTYKPYLLNGTPVEIETTITVNFNFSH